VTLADLTSTDIFFHLSIDNKHLQHKLPLNSSIPPLTDTGLNSISTCPSLRYQNVDIQF
jgi:hypothetical protein